MKRRHLLYIGHSIFSPNNQGSALVHNHAHFTTPIPLESIPQYTLFRPHKYFSLSHMNNAQNVEMFKNRKWVLCKEERRKKFKSVDNLGHLKCITSGQVWFCLPLPLIYSPLANGERNPLFSATPGFNVHLMVNVI